MIDTPTLVQLAAQHTAIIRLTIPREKIGEVMGPAYGEVMAVVAAQGATAVGRWFSHHLRTDPALFDFEVGVAVAAPIAAAGRVVAGHLPAVRALRTVYHGGYEGLGAAWGEFTQWAQVQSTQAQGHACADDFIECYLAGPESGSDTSQWRTELTRPLRD